MKQLKRTDPQFSRDLFEKNILSEFAIETRHILPGTNEEGISHIHNFHEILFYYEGTRNLIVNGETTVLNKNNVAFIAPFKFHQTLDSGGKESKRVLINFSSNFISSFSDDLHHTALMCFNTPNNSIHFDDSASKEIKKILQNMLYEYNTAADLFSPNIIKAELIKILSFAARSMQKNSQTFKISEDIQTHNIIIKIAEYITQNYNSKLTLELLENEFSVSKYYISRMFNKYMDMSIIDFINKIRIHEAKHLLLDNSSQKNISDIAYACGFETLVHFNRVFKSETRMTPSMFLKNITPRTSIPNK